MTRRHISAVVLLAVFLPMFMLSSFHVHPEAHSDGESCEECVHHLPHAGHISNLTVCSFDCVLCQFLTLPFLLAPVVVFKAKEFLHTAPLYPTKQSVVSGEGGFVFGRAPPCEGLKN